MPLGCDCYGGCWGDHSKDWPSIALSEKSLAEARKINSRYPESVAGGAIAKRANLPYGSYVIMSGSLRVETPELMSLVLEQILFDDRPE